MSTEKELEKELGNNSITVEEYDEKYKPLLNTVLDLMNTHPDIPEDVEQHEIISAVITMGNELSATLHNRVPEVVKLREEIAKKDRQINKLQETNQQLYLRVGALPNANQSQEGQEKPKKSFDEIKAMIDRM